MAETPQGDREHLPPEKADEQSEFRAWYQLSGIGIEFIVAVCLFGGIGWWIDHKAGTFPWLMLVGCGLGFAVGLYMLIRAAKQMFRD